MWARKKIDLRFRDLLTAIRCSIQRPPRIDSEQRIAASFHSDQTLVCYSVRSGFDLLLHTLNWPAGTEVIFSGLTISDMPRIAADHGLVPVGVDIDALTLSPAVADIESRISPRTRAIVIAHLMGGRCDLREIKRLAAAHDLILIEDCAQAFVGCHYQGSRQADVSMFSFGSIKTNTALGGAVLFVRDENLRFAMKSNQSRWPIQSESSFVRRISKYTVVKTLSTWPVAAIVRRMFRVFHSNHDLTVSRMAKGFAGPDFFERIRKRPSAGMMHFLSARIQRFAPDKIRSRTAKANALINQLTQASPSLAPIGLKALEPTHWVLAILVSNRQILVESLWQHGFDATTRSSLVAVNSEAAEKLPNISAILNNIVFLPLDTPMPAREIERMGRVIIKHAEPFRLFPTDVPHNRSVRKNTSQSLVPHS